MAKVVIRKGELLCQSTEKITYAAFLLSNSMNRPGFSRHSQGSLRNAFQTLPVTADC